MGEGNGSLSSGAEVGARAQSRPYPAPLVFGLAGLFAAGTGVSGYEAQAAILREAIRRYLAHPPYVLQPIA